MNRHNAYNRIVCIVEGVQAVIYREGGLSGDVPIKKLRNHVKRAARGDVVVW